MGGLVLLNLLPGVDMGGLVLLNLLQWGCYGWAGIVKSLLLLHSIQAQSCSASKLECSGMLKHGEHQSCSALKIECSGVLKQEPCFGMEWNYKC